MPRGGWTVTPFELHRNNECLRSDVALGGHKDMAAPTCERDQALHPFKPEAARNFGRRRGSGGALEPSHVDIGDRGEARRVGSEKRQQLLPLTLRTLVRHRLDEAKRRGDRHGGRGVAARQFFEHEGVQDGWLLE